MKAFKEIFEGLNSAYGQYIPSPIRSENGMKLISKNTTTGLVSDRTVGDYPKDARRWYLEEWFKKRPGINANLDQASTVEVQRTLNDHFEILGTNMTSALVTFGATTGGILATTAGADQDQAIIALHLDDDGTADTGAITAWSG